MKKILLSLLAVLLLASCNKFQERVLSDFTDNHWAANAVQEYAVVIPADVEKATLNIIFSHIYEPGYSEIPVTLQIKSPDGNEETIKTELLLKDTTGKNLSDCSGDVCDLVTVVKTGVFLRKGTYIFRLKNRMHAPFIPNVLAAGVEVIVVK